MFNATGVFSRGLAALHGTEAEQKLAVLLFDDNIQVISSLELNQMASYTYHETSIAGGQDLCEKILKALEPVLAKPADYSTFSVQKALVVLKHMLLFGAEKVINASMYLRGYVEELQNYNTAVLAQQGSMGMFMRFKGGTVDKGGPVRQVAQDLYRLLMNRQQLQFERSTNADPNSLVPIGSRNQAGFVTDEARLEILKRRMEQERINIQKSNLAKSSSAFGSGYTGRDGKNVVGAAHGLDEMIKQARREKQKFSDEAYQAPGSENAAALAAQAEAHLQDLLAMAEQQNPEVAAQSNSVDLLDFGGPAETTTATTTTSSYQSDLLGGSAWSAPAAPAGDVFGGLAGTGLTGSAPAPSNDPFGFASMAPTPATSDFAGLSPASPGTNSYGMPGSLTSAPASAPPGPPPPPPQATSQEDRFAALDALADSSSQPPKLEGSIAYNNATAAATPDISSLTDLSGLTISGGPVSMPMPAVDTSSLKVSQMAHAPIGDKDDDDDNPFVMGGKSGAGLKPLGPAPSAPPPPPPGGFY